MTWPPLGRGPAGTAPACHALSGGERLGELAVAYTPGTPRTTSATWHQPCDRLRRGCRRRAGSSRSLRPRADAAARRHRCLARVGRDCQGLGAERLALTHFGGCRIRARRSIASRRRSIIGPRAPELDREAFTSQLAAASRPLRRGGRRHKQGGVFEHHYYGFARDWARHGWSPQTLERPRSAGPGSGTAPLEGDRAQRRIHTFDHVAATLRA